MSKKIVTISSSGVRESVEGNRAELPTSVETRMSSSFVESVLSVATLTTGTVASHTYVVAAPVSLVILPATPQVGQSIKLFSAGAITPVGVSASHRINLGAATATAVNCSSSNLLFERTFTFVSSSAGYIWASPGAVTDSCAGISGTYTF